MMDRLTNMRRELDRMIYELEKEQEQKTHEVETQSYYAQGYACGYEWLTKGWNFLHPSEKYKYGWMHGYIPGGPHFNNKYGRWDTKEHKAESTRIRLCSNVWRDGWIDGINQYVCDNQLNFPMVSKGGI